MLAIQAQTAVTHALNSEGWLQAGELGLALLLSAVIGIEREVRQKDAGLRTHTLVGVGAALFMLISKYGFTDVAQPGLVMLDPSRVAAQIVSGVGFLGAGLIFVRRDSVRGLTTAAATWVAAAVGAAAGAGLPVLATLTAAIYVVVTVVFPIVARRLPRPGASASALKVRYQDGQGILRDVLREATDRGFAINEVAAETVGDAIAKRQMVQVTLHVHGKQPVDELAAALSQLTGVDAVLATETR